MKKAIPSVLAISLLATSLAAQEPGTGAAQASNSGRSNAWQGWVFAGGAIAAVVAGVIVIATHRGSDQVNFNHTH